MQQSYATQSLHLSFWGLRKIVACSHSSSQCLLVSTVFGTVSSLHPTSFLMIFILVYILIRAVPLLVYYTSIKIIKNEVGCRDDAMPKTGDTRRHCEVELTVCNNLPQPPKNEM